MQAAAGESQTANLLKKSGQVTPATDELPDDFFEPPGIKEPDCSFRSFLMEERKRGR
jgi:hypothetical protein